MRSKLLLCRAVVKIYIHEFICAIFHFAVAFCLHIETPVNSNSDGNGNETMAHMCDTKLTRLFFVILFIYEEIFEGLFYTALAVGWYFGFHVSVSTWLPSTATRYKNAFSVNDAIFIGGEEVSAARTKRVSK